MSSLRLPVVSRPAPIITTPASPGSSSALDSGRLTPLSVWDQTSMRAYMRVVLCFPFDNARAAEATAYIKSTLAALAKRRPDFAGKLEVGARGTVYLRTSPDDTIPFEAVDIAGEFGYATYDKLRAAEFPPGAFVGERFAVPCIMGEGKAPVPVSIIKAFLINGGLLLSIFFHHSFADGECLRMFLESFAGQTRNELIECASSLELDTTWDGAVNNGNTIMDGNHHKGKEPHTYNPASTILDGVPEYTLLDKPMGPTVPSPRPEGIPIRLIEKTGKIFVFKNEQLRQLRSALQMETSSLNGNPSTPSTSPSNYMCLAALTWAHVARARLNDLDYVAKGDADTPARLQTMVNWKSRAFQDESKDYFGNATAIALTRVATGRLIKACDDLGALAELINEVECTIRGVDEAWVQQRTAFFRDVADPRLVGLTFDPRTPQDLGFNTWRYFGADTEWRIPGVGGPGVGGARRPDVIRRTQDAWNMSGALILPARADSPVHELLVTLPKTSMEILCRDAEWMRWVDKTIG